MNYVDKYGLYNVKAVGEDDMPTGNDGFILSCYFQKVGGDIDLEKIERCFNELERKQFSNIPIERLPGKKTPYVSRDVILAWITLKLINLKDLKDADFNFSPVDLPKFNLAKTVASFILAVSEHRNFLWLKELTHAYVLLFMCPFQDRAFYYRCSGMKTPWHYRLIEWVDEKIPTKSNSSKLIRFLKYDIDPGLQTFIEYFGENHPITIAVARKILLTP